MMMILSTKSVVAALLLSWHLAFTPAAPIEVLAVCEPGDGYVYYVPGVANLGIESGWNEDKAGGSTTLIRQGKQYDILFRGVEGIMSASQDGGVILETYHDDDSRLFVVNYGTTLATYGFYKLETESMMLFTQLRAGTIFTKGAVQQANCSQINW